jgi:hypothetical protein
MIADGKGVYQAGSAISDGVVVIARYRFTVWAKRHRPRW